MNAFTMIPLINIAILVVLVLFVITGWRKGFLWKLISILSFFVTGILSWWLSAPLSNILHIYPAAWVPLAGTMLAPYIAAFLNRMMLFIVLFLLISISVKLLKPLFKFVQRIPVISTVNRIAGSALGAIQGILLLVIVSLFLRIPGWEAGNTIVKDSLLKHSDVVMDAALFYAREPLDALHAIQEGLANANTLTQEQIDDLRAWMMTLPIEKEKVDAFMGTFKSE